MFVSDLAQVSVAVPATITTTTTTAAIDVSSLIVANRSIRFLVAAAGVAGTTPSITATVQECATTNGTYADPPRVGTAMAAVTTNGIGYFDAFVTKQYVKVTVSFTANSTSAAVGVMAVGFKRINDGA